MVVGLERNQNLPVAGSDSGAIAEGEIDAGIRKTDVVEYRLKFLGRNQTADLLFHTREDALRLLDPRSGRAAHMQAHLSRVDVGKKVLTDEDDQPQGRDGEESKGAARHDPVFED